jgi:hypothetical protein
MEQFMDTSLSGPVGILHNKEKGNHERDVTKVQLLLNRACCEPTLRVVGKCDDETIEAINDFQTAWGDSGDGRISRDGVALKRLGALLDGPDLSQIKLKSVIEGGYLIRYSSVRPPRKYMAYLAFRNHALAPGDNVASMGELPFVVDVSDRPAGDALGPDQLPELLRQVGRLGNEGAWGITIHCTVYIARGTLVVSRSNSLPLQCPVKPCAGELDFDVTANDRGGPWHYSINVQGTGGSGSMLHHKRIYGVLLFKYAGLPTVDNKLRGFDCTTYPGSIYNLPSTEMYSYDALCNALVTKSCGVENVTKKDFLAFMEKHTEAVYLVWYGGHHITIIENGVCHEFNTGPTNGYNRNDPWSKRHWPDETYTVREITYRPAGRLYHAYYD